MHCSAALLGRSNFARSLCSEIWNVKTFSNISDDFSGVKGRRSTSRKIVAPEAIGADFFGHIS